MRAWARFALTPRGRTTGACGAVDALPADSHCKDSDFLEHLVLQQRALLILRPMRRPQLRERHRQAIARGNPFVAFGSAATPALVHSRSFPRLSSMMHEPSPDDPRPLSRKLSHGGCQGPRVHMLVTVAISTAVHIRTTTTDGACIFLAPRTDTLRVAPGSAANTQVQYFSYTRGEASAGQMFMLNTQLILPSPASAVEGSCAFLLNGHAWPRQHNAGPLTPPYGPKHEGSAILESGNPT